MKKIILPVILCILLSTGAYAAGTAQQNAFNKGLNDSFNGVDSNKNGTLSKDEFMNTIKSVFRDNDKNKDAILDYVEFVEYRCGISKSKKPSSSGKSKIRISRKLDKNDDGNVSEMECQEYWVEEYNNIDKNIDGKLTSGEYNNYYAEVFETMDGPDKDGIVTLKEYKVYWYGKSADAKSPLPSKKSR